MKFQTLKLYFVGLGFWFFATIIALFYYPILLILPISRIKKNHLAQDSNSFFFKVYVKSLISFNLIEVKIEGLEHLPQKEKCIFIANHPSLIDVLILLSMLPRVTCIVKEKVFHQKSLALAVRLAGYISNENPLDLIEKAQSVLNRESKILIFPEGTRSKPGQEFKFARGAASLAMLTSCKIVPIFISSTPRVMFEGNNWRDLKDFPIKFTVTLKEQIQPETFKSFKKPTSQLNQTLENLYRQP